MLTIELKSDDEIVASLKELLALKESAEEPYSPVGWSKCGECGFKPRCWEIAETNKDVALIYDVDKNVVAALRSLGVMSYEQLLEQFTFSTLSVLKKPRGKTMAKIGKDAESILDHANAIKTQQLIWKSKPEIPDGENWVMFDLEGLPPNLDVFEKVYLWGMQVFGSKQGKYIPAVSGFGEEGDIEGWQTFLSTCSEIFSQYGDNIKFIHWHIYEQTKLKLYIKRYGDPNGIAAKVLENCRDLHTITTKAVVLPLYSYSLKVVERYVGFNRTMEEFGGTWSMVQYIKAVETNDENLRQQVMNEILKYNEEDLQATWAVMQWLKNAYTRSKS